VFGNYNDVYSKDDVMATKQKTIPYEEFQELKWELKINVCNHMKPAHFVYIQSKLAELCVKITELDVTNGYSIKCPNRLCKSNAGSG